MAKKFSGLQKEALTLYRNCVRSIYQKPIVSIEQNHSKNETLSLLNKNTNIQHNF